jgi:hypothetical protein
MVGKRKKDEESNDNATDPPGASLAYDDVNDGENISGTQETKALTANLPNAQQHHKMWWSSYKDVWMDTVMTKDYCPEDCRLSGILLHVKANEMKRVVSIYASRNTRSGGAVSNTDTSYDRIFLFGCLGTNTCFIVISKNAKQSSYLLQGFSEKELCVGQTIVIVEPIYTNKTLGKDSNLPIFDVKKKFEPYDFPRLPEEKYSIPQEPSTRYFVIHGTSIEVMVPVMQRSTCSGYLCDRQGLKGNEKICCCLFNAGYSSLVLEVAVKVILDGEPVLEMHDYRSWKFTNLVISNLNPALSTDDFQGDFEKNMRAAIKSIVSYVNAHGGWTIVGWMRRGFQVDAVEKGMKTGGDEVTAENVSPHIIKMVPTIPCVAEINQRKYDKPKTRVEL